MKKYSLLLLPLLIGFVFNACESNCCGPVEETTPPPPPQPDLVAPTVNELNLNGIDANNECTPGETINITADTSDTDGTVTDTIWKIDGQEVANPTTTCPDDGQTRTICAIAVDNDGLKSDEKCVTITGKAEAVAQPTPPLALVTFNKDVDTTGDNGIFLHCEDMHDTDDIHLYPNDGPYLYGSNDPKDIKEVIWQYTYKYPDGTLENDPHEMTQTAYNEQENKEPGSCVKWFHTQDAQGNPLGTILFEVTALDDDDQATTTNYIYDIANQTLTPVQP